MTTSHHHTVRRIAFTSPGQVELITQDPPDPPQAHQALVQPIRLGICGSDLHALHGAHPGVPLPVYPGHEAVVRVLAVGDDADSHLIGRLALVNPLVTKADRDSANTDVNARVLGFRIPGLGATSAVVDTAQLHLVPPDVDPTAAVMGEPLAVGVHALRRAGIDDGHVVVIGGGTIGSCLLSALRALTACEVTVVELDEAKRDFAQSLGAARTLVNLKDWESGVVDAVFDCVAGQATLAQAADTVKDAGQIIVVGVPRDSREWILPMPRMQRYEITMKGTSMYQPRDIDEALRLIAEGQVDTKAWVSQTYPLSEVAHAYAAAERPDTMKVVIELDR
ncbi:MAG: zinc-binding dehydrogenase [Propionibacteriaceae bacterium]|jgi:2-desacetyl-2-hydroxyethyl bacteriochlorophyllide A dehydrogenase|nr:zinc-binding dehydrogenase [Propionibacteriaceae bacterium]